MDVLNRLKGGLVVSCQPVDDGAMDRPDIVAALAQAAVAGGASGIRIEGAANLRAARPVVSVPIIGIIKRDLADSPVRITPFLDDVRALVEAGADIVAYDATPRTRPVAREAILAAILDAGAIAMADCATFADGVAALAGGARIIGTTLSGYTAETEGANDGPDFDLIRAFRALGGVVMAEGRLNTPQLVALARAAGADCVTVGSAITRTEHVTSWFVTAWRNADRAALTGFAVDLGGTKTAAARIEAGQIVQHRQILTNAGGDLATQLDQMAALLADLGYTHGAPLGVAVTGRLDAQGGWHAVNKSTLPLIDGVPLGPALRARFGAVACHNDAAAAAFAEAVHGAGKGLARFVYLTVSTGIGGGIVLDGKLVQGRGGLAGHVGFMSSTQGSTLCGSGRSNTVESNAAGRAIARAAHDAGHAGIDARAVFAAAAKGEAWAETIIDRSAHAIAGLCANLTALLEPECIAIGGSIGLAPGYLARVRAHLAAEPALFQTDLAAATLAGDGPLLGALALTQQKA